MRTQTILPYSMLTNRQVYLVVAVVSAAMACAMITPQSLWIDEGGAAFIAIAPNLSSWWHRMRLQQDAYLQQIFQSFYLWGWEKIFGHSEIALRASNVPWFATGVTMLGYGIGADRVRRWCIVLLALTNAHLWYYVSEARPYVVLFAFSSMLAAFLARLSDSPSEVTQSGLRFRLFCVGVAGTCATTLVGVPWAVGSAAAFSLIVGRKTFIATLGRFWISTTLTLLVMLTFGFYYFWTIQAGFRATNVGKTGVSNAVFACYELLGLAGLGPARFDLRQTGARAFIPYLLILLLACALLLLVWRAALNRSEMKPCFTWRFVGAAVFAPFLMLLLAGMIMQMRLLGRHFTPLLPYILMIEAVGLQALLSKPRAMSRVAGVALVLILLTSALEIRLCSRHKRDDYRSASLLARTASKSGNTVWWVADQNTGAYYNVDFHSVLALRDTPPSALLLLAVPDLVLYSKPDIYDASGDIATFLRSQRLTQHTCCQAFSVWCK